MLSLGSQSTLAYIVYDVILVVVVYILLSVPLYCELLLLLSE